jgi:hypothetical protein
MIFVGQIENQKILDNTSLSHVNCNSN